METQATLVRSQVTRYVVNGQFNQAVLFFRDGSYVQFEHKTIDNRRAGASAAETMADHCCLALHLFRLNAKHLQLYLQDGSDAEFIAHSSSNSEKPES